MLVRLKEPKVKCSMIVKQAWDDGVAKNFFKQMDVVKTIAFLEEHGSKGLLRT